MPEPDPYALHLLTLYQDCASRRTMPNAGGLMDQDAELMRAFRIFDDRVAVYKKKKQYEHEREIAVRQANGRN